MALVFTESFGHYSTQAQLTMKFDAVLFGGVPVLNSTAARFGTQGCQMACGLGKNLSQQATYIIGTAVNFYVGLGGTTAPIFSASSSF